MDVATAFWNGELEEQIVMEQPLRIMTRKAESSWWAD